VTLSNKSAANNYAPRILAADLGANGVSRKRFAAAMDRLFERGTIHMKPYGAKSKDRFRIAIGGKQ
jgi:hypothetical protein